MTVQEYHEEGTAMGLKPTREVVRDAGTGKFVPKREATLRPNETETEKVPVHRTPKKG